jgi:hypothetical protein
MDVHELASVSCQPYAAGNRTSEITGKGWLPHNDNPWDIGPELVRLWVKCGMDHKRDALRRGLIRLVPIVPAAPPVDQINATQGRVLEMNIRHDEVVPTRLHLMNRLTNRRCEIHREGVFGLEPMSSGSNQCTSASASSSTHNTTGFTGSTVEAYDLSRRRTDTRWILDSRSESRCSPSVRRSWGRRLLAFARVSPDPSSRIPAARAQIVSCAAPFALWKSSLSEAARCGCESA